MYITQTLHRAVQQRPDDPLTISGDRTRTVVESAERVARLAAGLRRHGAGPDDRVGVLALNSDRYHESLFAIAWAGAVAVPLNVRWSPAEIAYALRDAQIRVLIVDNEHAAMVDALRARYPDVATVIFCGDGTVPGGMLSYEALIEGAEPVADTRRGGDAPFVVLYTSGTTGNPKGVVHSHDAVMVANLGTFASGDFITPGGRYLHVAPMFHIAGIAGLLGGMFAESTHVFVPTFDPRQVLSMIERHEVTDTLLVPTMIQMLVDAPELADHDVTSVRTIIYGASPISEALLERAQKAFPATGFTQTYGMTELGPGSATMLGKADHTNPARRRSAGRASPHMEVRIVDGDDREVHHGTVGEITVRGDNLMLGYLDRPEDTAEALRGGWMHTGDAAYMDDRGYVFIVDRIKDMIITGGENVYSPEVENVLAKHPSVANCAVIGVPDDKWGERVHAVVVLQPGDLVATDELAAHCRQHIAGYKTPRSIEFVEELPVSGAGKILKRELRDRYRND